MNYRMYEPADHLMISKWWEAWGWPVIPQSSLPKIGVIVEEMCAAFLYRTDSDLCWMDWFISDKETKRNGQIEYLIEVLTGIARELGARTLFCSVRNQHLIAKLEQAGFTGKETGMTNFIRIL